MKFSGRSVVTRRSVILDGAAGFRRLASGLEPVQRQGGKVFLLVDSNTEKFCLPLLVKKIPSLRDAMSLKIEAGEHSKSLQSAEMLWQQMAEQRTDRHSILVNVGGGVVSDLGGFVAAGWKRGIGYVNVPTTLIGMADAAIGGKTGVNVGSLKNQVGAFRLPLLVLIWPEFLSTLPETELRSGFAEVAKAALVGDAGLWRKLCRTGISGYMGWPFEGPAWKGMLTAVAAVKNRIVNHDFEERKERKLLNFGHTFGHALEAVGLKQGKPVTHGEAIAAGMVMAGYLSTKMAGLDPAHLEEIGRWVVEGFGRMDLRSTGLADLIPYLQNDKKNAGGRILFTLIAEPGKGLVNRECPEEMCAEALDYYKGL